jgi:glycosyltransferase involved in cell wall biosynthesis
MKKESMLFVTKLHFSKDGNGGQQRTYFLIKELSKYYNLYVLSPYTNADKLDIEADFILNKAVSFEKKLRKNKITRLMLKILNILLKQEEATKPIHQSNFATYILKKQLNKLKTKRANQHIDTIVFDTLSMVVNVKAGLFQNRILNAHNFDSELVQMNLDNKIENPGISAVEIESTKKNLEIYKRYEYNIGTHFTEIWVCSVADELKFKAVNPGTKTVFYELPNGSDVTERQFQPITSHYKKFLFVGSLNYFPNVNGVKWFVDTIFKHLPVSFELNIVGKSPNQEDFKYLDNYPNINLIGQVESVEAFYKNHDAFIVPLLEGSGTRLKILEALSYGKLVLSTPKGIEGINAKDGVHYLEFDNFETFKTNIINQLEDFSKLEAIRKHGRQLIEASYSWKKIVENYLKQRHEQ